MPASTNSIDLERDSTQYLSRADEVALSITGDITLEAWVKIESDPASNVLYWIVAKQVGSGTNRSYGWAYWNDAGTTKMTFWNSSDGGGVNEDRLSVNQTLTVGTWTHAAVTWTAATSTANHYIDGASIGTAAGVNTATFDSTNQLTIGNRGDGLGGTADMLVDDVRVWNVVRTTAQIADNRCIEIDSATNLQASWHLDNDLNDASGNGFTLTNNNSATFSGDVPACLGGGVVPSLLTLKVG